MIRHNLPGFLDSVPQRNIGKPFKKGHSGNSKGRPTKPPEELIIKRENGCWIWIGLTDKLGYGSFNKNKKRYSSHRYFYELKKGTIPKGLVIDHLCRNASCCNPEHLEAVTNKENILRGVGITAKEAKQTHCKNGHPLSGENLRLHIRGYRRCLTCMRNYSKEYWKNKDRRPKNHIEATNNG